MKKGKNIYKEKSSVSTTFDWTQSLLEFSKKSESSSNSNILIKESTEDNEFLISKLSKSSEKSCDISYFNIEKSSIVQNENNHKNNSIRSTRMKNRMLSNKKIINDTDEFKDINSNQKNPKFNSTRSTRMKTNIQSNTKTVNDANEFKEINTHGNNNISDARQSTTKTITTSQKLNTGKDNFTKSRSSDSIILFPANENVIAEPLSILNTDILTDFKVPEKKTFRSVKSNGLNVGKNELPSSQLKRSDRITSLKMNHVLSSYNNKSDKFTTGHPNSLMDSNDEFSNLFSHNSDMNIDKNLSEESSVLKKKSIDPNTKDLPVSGSLKKKENLNNTKNSSNGSKCETTKKIINQKTEINLRSRKQILPENILISESKNTFINNSLDKYDDRQSNIKESSKKECDDFLEKNEVDKSVNDENKIIDLLNKRSIDSISTIKSEVIIDLTCHSNIKDLSVSESFKEKENLNNTKNSSNGSKCETTKKIINQKTEINLRSRKQILPENILISESKNTFINNSLDKYDDRQSNIKESSKKECDDFLEKNEVDKSVNNENKIIDLLNKRSIDSSSMMKSDVIIDLTYHSNKKDLPVNLNNTKNSSNGSKCETTKKTSNQKTTINLRSRKQILPENILISESKNTFINNSLDKYDDRQSNIKESSKKECDDFLEKNEVDKSVNDENKIIDLLNKRSIDSISTIKSEVIIDLTFHSNIKDVTVKNFSKENEEINTVKTSSSGKLCQTTKKVIKNKSNLSEAFNEEQSINLRSKKHILFESGIFPIINETREISKKNNFSIHNSLIKYDDKKCNIKELPKKEYDNVLEKSDADQGDLDEEKIRDLSNTRSIDSISMRNYEVISDTACHPKIKDLSMTGSLKIKDNLGNTKKSNNGGICKMKKTIKNKSKLLETFSKEKSLINLRSRKQISHENTLNSDLIIQETKETEVLSKNDTNEIKNSLSTNKECEILVKNTEFDHDIEKSIGLSKMKPINFLSTRNSEIIENFGYPETKVISARRSSNLKLKLPVDIDEEKSLSNSSQIPNFEANKVNFETEYTNFNFDINIDKSDIHSKTELKYISKNDDVKNDGMDNVLVKYNDKQFNNEDFSIKGDDFFQNIEINHGVIDGYNIIDLSETRYDLKHMSYENRMTPISIFHKTEEKREISKIELSNKNNSFLKYEEIQDQFTGFLNQGCGKLVTESSIDKNIIIEIAKCNDLKTDISKTTKSLSPVHEALQNGSVNQIDKGNDTYPLSKTSSIVSKKLIKSDSCALIRASNQENIQMADKSQINHVYNVITSPGFEENQNINSCDKLLKSCFENKASTNNKFFVNINESSLASSSKVLMDNIINTSNLNGLEVEITTSKSCLSEKSKSTIKNNTFAQNNFEDDLSINKRSLDKSIENGSVIPISDKILHFQDHPEFAIESKFPETVGLDFNSVLNEDKFQSFSEYVPSKTKNLESTRLPKNVKKFNEFKEIALSSIASNFSFKNRELGNNNDIQSQINLEESNFEHETDNEDEGDIKCSEDLTDTVSAIQNKLDVIGEEFENIEPFKNNQSKIRFSLKRSSSPKTDDKGKFVERNSEIEKSNDLVNSALINDDINEQTYRNIKLLCENNNSDNYILTNQYTNSSKHYRSMILKCPSIGKIHDKKGRTMKKNEKKLIEFDPHSQVDHFEVAIESKFPKIVDLDLNSVSNEDKFQSFSEYVPSKTKNLESTRLPMNVKKINGFKEIALSSIASNFSFKNRELGNNNDIQSQINLEESNFEHETDNEDEGDIKCSEDLTDTVSAIQNKLDVIEEEFENVEFNIDYQNRFSLKRSSSPKTDDNEKFVEQHSEIDKSNDLVSSALINDDINEQSYRNVKLLCENNSSDNYKLTNQYNNSSKHDRSMILKCLSIGKIHDKKGRTMKKNEKKLNDFDSHSQVDHFEVALESKFPETVGLALNSVSNEDRFQSFSEYVPSKTKNLESTRLPMNVKKFNGFKEIALSSIASNFSFKNRELGNNNDIQSQINLEESNFEHETDNEDEGDIKCSEDLTDTVSAIQNKLDVIEEEFENDESVIYTPKKIRFSLKNYPTSIKNYYNDDEKLKMGSDLLDLSFINPTDPIISFKGIYVQEGKRTRIQPVSGPRETLIYKNNVISHRLIFPSPKTVKDRKARMKINRKSLLSKSIVENLENQDQTDLSKYNESPDGINVSFFNPETELMESRNIVFPESCIFDNLFISKRTYSINPKTFGKLIAYHNLQCIVEIDANNVKLFSVYIVVDKCKLPLKSNTKVIVPRGVPYFIYNQNSHKISVVEKFIS